MRYFLRRIIKQKPSFDQMNKILHGFCWQKLVSYVRELNLTR